MCHESCEGEGRQIFAQIILLRAEGRRRKGGGRGGDAEFKAIVILKKKGAVFIVWQMIFSLKFISNGGEMRWLKIDKLEYRSNAGLIGENSFYLSRVYRSQSFDFLAWTSTYHL